MFVRDVKIFVLALNERRVRERKGPRGSARIEKKLYEAFSTRLLASGLKHKAEDARDREKNNKTTDFLFFYFFVPLQNDFYSRCTQRSDVHSHTPTPTPKPLDAKCQKANLDRQDMAREASLFLRFFVCVSVFAVNYPNWSSFLYVKLG